MKKQEEAAAKAAAKMERQFKNPDSRRARLEARTEKKKVRP